MNQISYNMNQIKYGITHQKTNEIKHEIAYKNMKQIKFD